MGRLGFVLTRAPWLRELSMLPVLVLLIIGLAVFDPSVLGISNIMNVLSQSTVVAIAAVGATIVILTGGIDLSTGSTISASGVGASAVMVATGSTLLGIVLGVVLGMITGLVIGLLVTRLSLVPFVVSLAGLFVVSGVTLILSGGATIASLPTDFTYLSIATFAGVPVLVVITILLYVIAQVVLARTVWGRRVILLGASRKTSRISGAPVARVETSVYAVAGAFSGIAGVALAAKLFGANASMGNTSLLNVVGAVVLGGTSLFGGQGSVVRTGIGVLILGFLANGMNLIGLPSYDQVLVTGLVILLAACMDAAVHKRKR